MFATKSHPGLAAGLTLAVTLWGANNVGVKFLVGVWPPIWIGCSRMFCVGALMLALLRWTKWLGPLTPLSGEMKRDLWRRSGFELAVYVVAFTWSLKFTSASHMAVVLCTAPVWALLLEGRPRGGWDTARRYGAAALAMAGVFVLLLPKLQHGTGSWRGDLLALAASLLWTLYSRDCRRLGATLSGAEITAHTMWRAAVWLAPMAMFEVALHPVVWRVDLVLIQLYCIVCSGVVAFALWNNALRHWPTSQVFLFGNLIPVTTMLWARVLIHEPVTPTFGVAMLLVIAGVVLGQANWQRIIGSRWLPSE